MKVNHIGYLVKHFEKAKKSFLNLGYKVISEVTHDQIRHVDICFLEKDHYVIELVSPYDKESVVAGMLKKYKNMPYHICYEVDGLDQAIEELEKVGYAVIGEPECAPAFDNRKVIFLMNANSGMIELLESN